MMDKNASFFETIIPTDWKGKTLHQYLRQELQLSRGRVRALKQTDGIFLDQKAVWVSAVLNGGEQLVLRFDSAEQNFAAEKIDLSIVYEDQDIVVVNKPAGMVVHPVKKHQSGTLANALKYHWQSNGENVSFHPLHRLDRLTSGLVLIAKNPWAHQQLDLQIQSRSLHRLYLAICQGNPLKESGRVEAPIKSYLETPRREIAPDGQYALTRFRVLDHSAIASLLVIKLYTGRTHQIRVHLSHSGNPLWGDPLYGLPDPLFPRPALHAVKLSFIHPRNKKPICVKSDLPEDFKRLMEEKLDRK